MSEFLRAERLVRRFGGLVAVRDISFTQAEGEILGIIGPNGAGKSTLFNMIAGAERPTSGEVLFRGERITGLPLDAIARRGLVKTFQTSRPFASMTFLENVMTAAFAVTRDKATAVTKAEEALGVVGLDEHADRPAKGASTGQRKRLEVARALAVEPKLLLLDEPFGGVDMTAIESLIALFRRIRDEGMTILLIEHNLEAVQSFADRLIAMNLGARIAEGKPADVVHDAAVVRAYLGDEDEADAA
jgi:branched-chain amino acid transport system ATP-binding protein